MIRPGNGHTHQAGAAIERQGFGTREMERRNETQAIAAAELAKATIQARYIVAMQRPRDIDDSRVRMLKARQAPGVRRAGQYAKPVGGGKVRGMSIRFVEAALQEYGNVIPEVVRLRRRREADHPRLPRPTSSATCRTSRTRRSRSTSSAATARRRGDRRAPQLLG